LLHRLAPQDGVPHMTVVELKEFESLEHLQSLFRDPEAQERLQHLGVRTALVATWDGLLIDSVVCDDEPVELETLAANAAAALQMSHKEGPARGRVDGILAEFDSGSTVIIDPVGDNSLVAFVTRPASDVAQLRSELRTLAQIRLAGGPARSASIGIPEATAPVTVAPERAPVTPAPAPRQGPLPVRPKSVPAASPLQAPVPARPKAAPVERAAAATVREIVRSTPAGRRVILKQASLEAAGFAATATVELAYNGEKIVGKAVARNDSAQYLYVAAEAAVRAVSELLPPGYGIVLEHVAPVASEADQSIKAISVKVLFLTPAGEQTLLGIAKIVGDEPVAAAKTVLSAVNASLESLLSQRGDRVH